MKPDAVGHSHESLHVLKSDRGSGNLNLTYRSPETGKRQLFIGLTAFLRGHPRLVKGGMPLDLLFIGRHRDNFGDGDCMPAAYSAAVVPRQVDPLRYLRYPLPCRLERFHPVMDEVDGHGGENGKPKEACSHTL